jgi:hypothetical protein
MKRGWSGSTPTARVWPAGVAKLRPSAVVRVSDVCVKSPPMPPAAAATPGSARIVGSTDAGTIGSPLVAPSTMGRPDTTASVPA